MEGALLLSVTSRIQEHDHCLAQNIQNQSHTQGTTESSMKHITASFTTFTLKHMLQNDIKESSKGGSSSTHHSEEKNTKNSGGKPEETAGKT